jgi:hypothetical protein
MCRRFAQQEMLFNRMIERCGVDVGRAVRLERGEAYARAKTKCLVCRASVECGQWLDIEGEQAVTPAFCPNRVFFCKCVPGQRSL